MELHDRIRAELSKHGDGVRATDLARDIVAKHPDEVSAYLLAISGYPVVRDLILHLQISVKRRVNKNAPRERFIKAHAKSLETGDLGPVEQWEAENSPYLASYVVDEQGTKKELAYMLKSDLQFAIGALGKSASSIIYGQLYLRAIERRIPRGNKRVMDVLKPEDLLDLMPSDDQVKTALTSLGAA